MLSFCTVLTFEKSLILLARFSPIRLCTSARSKFIPQNYQDTFDVWYIVCGMTIVNCVNMFICNIARIFWCPSIPGRDKARLVPCMFKEVKFLFFEIDLL